MFSLCLLLSPYNLFRTAKRLTRRLLLLFLFQKKELENVNTSQSNYSRRNLFITFYQFVSFIYLSVCLSIYLDFDLLWDSLYVFLTALALPIWTGLASNSHKSSCLCLPNVGIKGMHNDAQLIPSFSLEKNRQGMFSLLNKNRNHLTLMSAFKEI